MKNLINKLKLKISLKNRASERICKLYQHDKTDSWAIVTGCTSGIGKAYAEFLYQNNFRLILISRNEEKLKNLSDNLTSDEGKILTLKMDFSDDDLYNNEKFQKYLKILSEKRIRLLVNNVGESTFGGDFVNYDFKKNKSLVNVNVNSNIFMTKLFLESQINYAAQENNSNDRRGIINVSSYFGLRPVPGVAMYSSTKAFVSNFSSCLFYELKNIKNFHVDMLCINPLFIKTNMVRKWNNRLIIQPQQLVYTSCVKINGYKVHSYGNWNHKLQAYFLNLIPNSIFCRLSEAFYRKQYESVINKLKLRRKKKN